MVAAAITTATIRRFSFYPSFQSSLTPSTSAPALALALTDPGPGPGPGPAAEPIPTSAPPFSLVDRTS